MRRPLPQLLLLAVTAGVVLAGCSAERITAAPPGVQTAPQRVAIGSGNVLYVLDGKVIDRKPTDTLAVIPSEIRALDPDDVSRIEVIKGEAARKRYGAAGENGVVLITTKRHE